MNQDDLDRELQRLLTEQRLADEASAPGFRELIERSRRAAAARDGAAAATRDGRWAWRAAVVAAACFALAVGLYLLRQGPDVPRPARDTTLASWRAPSDSLLQTPGSELFSSIPVLLPSVPAGGAGGEASRAREATPRSTQTKVPQPQAQAHAQTKGVES